VDFKQNIREVAAISPNMLQHVTQNFPKSLEECVDNKGRHLTDTIEEVNVVIKMLWVKGNFSNKFA